MRPKASPKRGRDDDAFREQHHPRVPSTWSALAPSGRSRRAAPSDAAALRDEVIAAKERVMRALMAVGPEVAGVLVDICCELKGPGGGGGGSHRSEPATPPPPLGGGGGGGG